VTQVEWTAGPIPVDTTWFPPSGAADNGHGRDGRAVICQTTATEAAAATTTTVINGTKVTSSYVIGKDGSNDCPKGSARVTWAECKEANAGFGFDFDGQNSSNPDDPGGCFVFQNQRGFYHPRAELGNQWGKELIVKYTSGVQSGGTWYTDSNGKEMVKRQYNKRGPSYPTPYKISEPVAGNYYPVNAMMAIDDGANELVILTDVSQGGASLADGELEFMVHRRVLADDSRGVQEPLNETMCGCNDINAAPGSMGAHGHLGDGGCECAGLTMRGRHWVVFDTIAKAHEARRVLGEDLNFPATLAFAPKAMAPLPASSALATAMPAGVKLVTLTSNYAAINEGQLLLRISHQYQAGEHPTLAQPITFSLAAVFAKAGLKIATASETSLTANQDVTTMDANKFDWPTAPGNERVAAQLAAVQPFESRFPFDSNDASLTVTVRPMEVRTFLATFD
jgi:alpha-mannosidase